MEQWLGRCYERADAAWRLVVGRPITATAILIGVSLTAMLAITGAMGFPEAREHDELSRLVMSDMFSHGRLCDPPHPFWAHFETFHVLSQPCYTGKYPAGTALFMSIGQLASGQPIMGIWLSLFAMIAATSYAMYAWLPPNWALLAAALVTVRFGLTLDWSETYWGGTVAAAGGALVLGAIGRVRLTPRARDGVILGVGLLLLALSRPYEGLAYCIPAGAVLAWRLVSPWPGRRRLWTSVLPAIIAISVAGVAWMAYYNWRITGSLTTLPYVVYEDTYAAAPQFVWGELRDPGPVFRHLEMANFEQLFGIRHYRLRSEHWPQQKLVDLRKALWTYVSPTLLLAALGLFSTRRCSRRGALLAAAFLVLVSSSFMFTVGFHAHYLAPATAALFLLLTIGLEGMNRWRFGWIRGSVLVAAIVLPFAISKPIETMSRVDELRKTKDWWVAKRDIRTLLLSLPGDDLVFVRYKPTHNFHNEWVYNGAEIDRQPIVWAREIDAQSDARLRAHFGERKAWVVSADASPVKLREWPGRKP